jgi:hypothetical protein
MPAFLVWFSLLPLCWLFRALPQRLALQPARCASRGSVGKAEQATRGGWFPQERAWLGR